MQISITNEIDFILNCQIKDAPPEIDLTETKNILFFGTDHPSTSSQDSDYSNWRWRERISPIKQHTSLIVFLILFFVLSNVLDERKLIRQFADLYDNFSFYFVYAYIPLLFLIVQFKPQKDTGEQNQ